jgi:hypothetical protein
METTHVSETSTLFIHTPGNYPKEDNIQLSGCCAGLRTRLWNAIWVWKSTFWNHTWIFSQKIWVKSLMNTVKDFTKTLWLWKMCTMASRTQVCWQTIAGHWRGMYLMPTTDESHTPLHFRRKFLPVSLACKVLLCTFKFLNVFETLLDRKVLYTYLNSG